jgi:hypothetical protein
MLVSGISSRNSNWLPFQTVIFITQEYFGLVENVDLVICSGGESGRFDSTPPLFQLYFSCGVPAIVLSVAL